MVWPYIPGCNIHRGAEGDNSVECFGVTRKPHKSQKENTSVPKWSAIVMHTPSKPPHPPTAAMHASRPTWNLARSSVSTERSVYHYVRRTDVESGDAPRLNTNYCPELGVMYELAKGKLPSKRLKFNFPDLFLEEKKRTSPTTTSFQEPARLVSSESLLRWNVPSVPWRYLVQGNVQPIPITAMTKDTQTALTCVASDLEESTEDISASNKEPKAYTTSGEHGCNDEKPKDRVVDRECREMLSKGVQTPRHKGVQTETQTANEGSVAARNSSCSLKEESSRKDSVSKSKHADYPRIVEFKATKTSEPSSNPTKTQKTNLISTLIERQTDSKNRTCKGRPIKTRKGKKCVWRKNRRSPVRETLISNLIKTEVTAAAAQCKEETECFPPNEDKSQASTENADDVEARKLHVRPTLSMAMPVVSTTPIINSPLAKHEPIPSTVPEDVQVKDTGNQSEAGVHAVEDLDTKVEKEQQTISDCCRNTATESQNSRPITACTQLNNTEGTKPPDATKETILPQDKTEDYLLRITSKKKTTDDIARTKEPCDVKPSQYRKKRDKAKRKVVKNLPPPVESVSVASSTESLEALERLIEMQHAELVSKGVLPADKDLALDQSLHTDSKDSLHLLIDDGSISTDSATSLPNEEQNVAREETFNVCKNQSNVTSEEGVQVQDSGEGLLCHKQENQLEDLSPEDSCQDSYLSQLMQSLSLTQSDDEGVEKSSTELSLIQNSGTSDMSESSQNPHNSSSDTADSATAAAIVALTDYQSRISSDRRIYDVEVFRQ